MAPGGNCSSTTYLTVKRNNLSQKALQKKPGKALKKRLLSGHPTQAGER